MIQQDKDKRLIPSSIDRNLYIYVSCAKNVIPIYGISIASKCAENMHIITGTASGVDATIGSLRDAVVCRVTKGIQWSMSQLLYVTIAARNIRRKEIL